jgi:hypothetical protein
MSISGSFPSSFSFVHFECLLIFVRFRKTTLATVTLATVNRSTRDSYKGIETIENGFARYEVGMFSALISKSSLRSLVTATAVIAPLSHHMAKSSLMAHNIYEVVLRQYHHLTKRKDPQRE